DPRRARCIRRRPLQARAAQEGAAQRALRGCQGAGRRDRCRTAAMSASRGTGQRFSLARWSRRKLQAAAQAAPATPPVATPTAAPSPASAAPELPAVESLTLSSDFTAFLRPEVDDNLRRAALKQLFRDPRFNIMDGLDTYIDDYTQADPIAPDVLADLLQRGFGSPDAPDDAPAAGPAAAAAAAAEPAPPMQPIAASSPQPGAGAPSADGRVPAPRE